MEEVDVLEPMKIFYSCSPFVEDSDQPVGIFQYIHRKEAKPFLMYVEDLGVNMKGYSRKVVEGFAHRTFPFVKAAYLEEKDAVRKRWGVGQKGAKRFSNVLHPVIVKAFEDDYSEDVRARRCWVQVDSERRNNYGGVMSDIDRFVQIFDNDCLV